MAISAKLASGDNLPTVAPIQKRVFQSQLKDSGIEIDDLQPVTELSANGFALRLVDAPIQLLTHPFLLFL